MKEAEIAVEVTKGVRGVIQDFIVPDIRTIIAELKNNTKLLDKHGEKLDNLTDSVQQLDLKQTEILTAMTFEERLDSLEAAAQKSLRKTIRHVRPF